MPIGENPMWITPAEIIMTKLHAGCRFMKKHDEIGEGFCETGMAVVNAVSEWGELTINAKGKQCHFRFQKGERVSGPVFSNSNKPDSTTLVIKPDYELLGNLRFSFDGISEKVVYLRERFSQFEISVVKENRNI